MIRPKLRLAIKVSFLLFGLNTLLYLYNPYYLLRPHQIEQNDNVERINLNGPSNKIENVPNEVYNLLDIANSPMPNFSTTRETRVKLFLRGSGNCSQQSTGMGEVLSNDKFNCSFFTSDRFIRRKWSHYFKCYYRFNFVPCRSSSEDGTNC